ncbi:MAG: hypothetical protein O3C63_06445 [Cyanobacteria bacterium]|nr:hypothetical protein [Cyanobacteriota bacterium]MDA1021429.1 hypothetical protein [Cyanobacteriota bacterium]
MLSETQKKLRDISKASSELDSKYNIRALESKYDKDRVVELWANLTMIQQMRGNSHWTDESTKSGLKWNEYIFKLIKTRACRVIVFETVEEIFGFAYMQIAPLDANNPKRKTKTKAIIKELYLEPAYRKQARDMEMAEMMRDCINDMGIDFVEFDVQDLDI